MSQKNSDRKKTGKENKQENPATVETGQAQATPEVIQNIELSMIVCNPFNPRKYRMEEDLQELTQSIVNFGIIQPITLRKKGEQYEIVCGERRYRASVQAGLSTIQAIIKEYSDEEAMEICILENLQRRDINPVEEAVSFGKLMEVRKYSIDDLVKQFGKTDKYIRSRLQLRNLTDETAGLLVREEITLAVALELARFCPEIQKDVYENHLSEDNTYSWKNLQAKEFCKMLENGYSADLSNYEFDKTDCLKCQFNSSCFDLFADGNGGYCQNMECLRYKQAEYIASETNRMLSDKPNIGICVAPNSFASAEVVDNLSDTGYEIYEMVANPLPVEPQKPLPERFESETEYQEAEILYETNLQEYRLHSKQIETMVEQGTAQLLVDVSKRKPEMCYRIVSETEIQSPVETDTVEKLHSQDRRNKEIAIEKGVEDVKCLVRENTIPNIEFQQLEERLIYHIMLFSLRKENFAKLRFNTQIGLTDKEKDGIIASLTDEQKNIIKRDFIIKHLTDTSADRGLSHLLLEFATLHFPEKVKQIKELHNDNYRKKHIRIEERIREIQPFTGTLAKETGNVPEQTEEAVVIESEETAGPDVFINPDMDDIPLYPGLPERVSVGEIPEEEEYLNTVYEEIAA